MPPLDTTRRCTPGQSHALAHTSCGRRLRLGRCSAELPAARPALHVVCGMQQAIQKGSAAASPARVRRDNPAQRPAGLLVQKQASRHPRQHDDWSGRLNSDIKAARSLHQLQHLLVEHQHRMDCVHLSALCTTLVHSPAALGQLGQRSQQELQPFVAALSAAVHNTVRHMKPRQSSTLIWALGKMWAQISQGTAVQQQANLLPGPGTVVADHGSSSQSSVGINNASSTGTSTVASHSTLLTQSSFAPATSTLLQRLASTVMTASGRDIAQALYGAAQQQQRLDATLLARLLSSFQQLLPSCQPQDLSMCVYALAVLGANPGPSWVAAFDAASRPKLDAFTCQALSNVVWAFFTLKQHPSPAWLDAFARTSQRSMALLSNQELSTIAWVLSQMQTDPDPSWMSSLEEEATARLATMNGQDVSLLLGALQHFSLRPSAMLLAALSGRLVAGGATGMGVVTLTVLPPAPVQQLLPSSSSMTGDLPSGHAAWCPAVVLPSSATAQETTFQQQPLSSQESPSTERQMQLTLPGLGGASAGNVQHVPKQDLCNSCSNYQQPHDRQQKPWTGSGGGAAAAHAALEPRSACRVLTQLSQLGVAPSQGVLDAMLTDLNPSLPSMQAVDLVSLLHALARMHHQPRRRWMVRYLRLLRLRLPSMNPPQLAGMLWSLARLGIRPDERWMGWVMLECQQRLPGFEPQELANVVWALARLGCKPRPQWLGEFFHYTQLKLHRFRMRELAMMAEAVAQGRFQPPEAWVERMQAEVAARAALDIRHLASSVAAGHSRAGQMSQGRDLGQGHLQEHAGSAHTEVYAVLRALARMDGKLHGRLPAPSSMGCQTGAVLVSACMASLALARGPSGHGRPASTSTF